MVAVPLTLAEDAVPKPKRGTSGFGVGWFYWRDSSMGEALAVVKPERFIKWHRKALRAFCRWKSRKRERLSFPANIRYVDRQDGAREHAMGRGVNRQ